MTHRILQMHFTIACFQCMGNLFKGDEFHILADGSGLHKEELLVRILSAQLVANATLCSGDDDILFVVMVCGIVQNTGGTADVICFCQNSGDTLGCAKTGALGCASFASSISAGVTLA